jgi:hypothetical protein
MKQGESTGMTSAFKLPEIESYENSSLSLLVLFTLGSRFSILFILLMLSICGILVKSMKQPGV